MYLMLGHKVALINEAELVNSCRVLSGERIVLSTSD